MKKSKPLLTILLLLILCTRCNDDPNDHDSFGIDRDKEETLQGIIVDTRIGWLFLNERYGFMIPIADFADSLKIDGLKLELTTHVGDTFYDDNEYFDFTYLELIQAQIKSNLYASPPVEVYTIWSPDFSDNVNTFPDGYGYRVTVDGALKILQPDIGIIPGIHTYKLENDAFKVGCYIAHLLNTKNGLPSIDLGLLNFMNVSYPPS